MGFTFSLKMVGTKILVPRSWYQDLGTKILVPRSGTKILARPGMARHGNIWHGTDPQGTARKYLARHGSTRSGHGTARDVPATSASASSQLTKEPMHFRDYMTASD